ncbi:hypothetical protein JNK13_12075 [bacterium]|nr:hypothetical protein [bacterium]
MAAMRLDSLTQSKQPADNVLGIWDGHDAGACLVANQNILVAINEERLSRRKLEIGFPKLSILAALEQAGLNPAEITAVAISTTDPAKTLSRSFPALKENYYQLRRRKCDKPFFLTARRNCKSLLTALPAFSFGEKISRQSIRADLCKLGFAKSTPIIFYDHHDSHLASALYTSGYSECAVLSLDGVGDGISGKAWDVRNQEIKKITQINACNSLGLFYEYATTLLNMRELEDEGKVMALACYGVPQASNPLKEFFVIEDLNVQAKYPGFSLYRQLEKLFWKTPIEQFAWMVQDAVEYHVLKLIRNLLKFTKQANLALAGGVFANVKLNLLIRELPEVERLWIFPHMGDGGLAAGSALLAAGQGTTARNQQQMTNPFLGTNIGAPPAISTIKKIADLILQDEIIFWCTGAMEYGPRALGARSIIARPDSTKVRDDLNMKLKKRVWYQPFCPTLLANDAHQLLENYYGEESLFMTSAYRVKSNADLKLAGVMHIDGTCRPQIIAEERVDHPFFPLLKELRRLSGYAVILNTSLNIHGEPVVASTEDAFKAYHESDLRYMLCGNQLHVKE